MLIEAGSCILLKNEYLCKTKVRKALIASFLATSALSCLECSQQMSKHCMIRSFVGAGKLVIHATLRLAPDAERLVETCRMKSLDHLTWLELCLSMLCLRVRTCLRFCAKSSSSILTALWRLQCNIICRHASNNHSKGEPPAAYAASQSRSLSKSSDTALVTFLTFLTFFQKHVLGSSTAASIMLLLQRSNAKSMHECCMFRDITGEQSDMLDGIGTTMLVQLCFVDDCTIRAALFHVDDCTLRAALFQSQPPLEHTTFTTADASMVK